MLTPPIIEAYQLNRPRLDEAREKIERDLRSLLAARAVHVHSVSSRVKELDSLLRKVSRPDKSYQSLWDITDVVGLRVVTFFEDTIDEVAALIEQSFEIDFQNSTNKLRQGDYDRFGYRSLHYVCYAGKSENEFRFEIQVRTILQHAWAEIEHDLGYKAGDLAPAKIRRRFSRIASLLEIADQEFVSIRSDLSMYVNSVGSLPTRIDQTLALDVVSLTALARHPEVQSFDELISRYLEKSVGHDAFYPDYLCRMLRFSGFQDIASPLRFLGEQRSRLQALVPVYFRFLEVVFKFNAKEMSEVPCGYGLLLLVHLAILDSEQLEINKVRRLADLYAAVDELFKGTSPIQIATQFMEILKADEKTAKVSLT